MRDVRTMPKSCFMTTTPYAWRILQAMLLQKSIAFRHRFIFLRQDAMQPSPKSKGIPSKAVRVALAVDGASVVADNAISNMPMVYQGTDMSIGIISEFTVDSPCYIRVRVILGTTDPSVSTGADIDEVDVRPIGLYGIGLSGYNHSLAEIRNGTIHEGRSQAIYSHALYKTGLA